MIDTDERALAVLADAIQQTKDSHRTAKTHAMRELLAEQHGNLTEALAHLHRRLAQPDQSEPVATFVLSEASAGDEWPNGPLQLTPAGQRLPPGEYTVYTHPDRTQAPGESGVLVRLHRPEGYEDVHPELVLADAGIHPAFRPELAAAPTPPSVPGKGESHG